MTTLDAIRDRAWHARPPSFGNSGRRDTFTIERNIDLELTEVTQLPMLTLAGTMWMHTIAPPKKTARDVGELCRHCAQEAHCRDAVRRGDFVACERPLRKEML